MKIPNVNCKHADGYGFCNKKPLKFFGMFKQSCPEAEMKVCDIAERHPRPKAPPAPQSPRKTWRQKSKQAGMGVLEGYVGTRRELHRGYAVERLVVKFSNCEVHRCNFLVDESMRTEN